MVLHTLDVISSISRSIFFVGFVTLRRKKRLGSQWPPPLQLAMDAPETQADAVPEGQAAGV